MNDTAPTTSTADPATHRGEPNVIATNHLKETTNEPHKTSLPHHSQQPTAPRPNTMHGDPRLLKAAQDLPAAQLKLPGGFRKHYVASKEVGNNFRHSASKAFLNYLAHDGKFSGEYPADSDDSKKRASDLESVSESLSEGEDPVSPPPKVGTISVPKAVFMLLKGFIGTGVVFLPKAVSNGGLTFSVLMLLLMGAVNLLSMYLLVQTRKKISGSFGEIGGALFGQRMRTTVKISIVLMQVGICCCYVIFVAKTMKSVVASLSNCAVDFPEFVYILLQLIVYSPLAMIRKIDKLGGIVMIANCFVVLGLGYLVVYDIIRLNNAGIAPDLSLFSNHFNSGSFTLFIGTSIFSFEGIGLILPIAEAMKEPEKFMRTLAGSMLVITSVFIIVGGMSFLAFGDQVASVVFLNFPKHNAGSFTIQILYVLAIIFSVPLTLFPAIRIIESPIWTQTGRLSTAIKWKKNALRTFICGGMIGLAIAGAQDFDRFVALVGAVACIPLMFIYPALFHLKAMASTRRQQIIDIALIAFGAVCMIFVTVMTLKSWIEGEMPEASEACVPN